MSAEILLQQFERLAEAPNAASRLRDIILGLAVSGKLVAQDPKDNGPSELLKRLASDRDGTSTIGRRRASRSPVATSLDSLPFAVPNSWGWTYLTYVCEVSYGFAFASSGFRSPGTGTPLIRIRDISSVDTEAYFEGPFDGRYLVQPGDILVGMDGDFNVREWKGPTALLNQRVMRLAHWKYGISSRWVTIPLQMLLVHLHSSTSQTTVKHLSAKQVNDILVPLPPVAEQHRIVAKVDELLALCDQLEAVQRERESRRDALLESLSYEALKSPGRRPSPSAKSDP